MPVMDSEFKMLDRPPTKPDYYIARGVQSQFCAFVSVTKNDDTGELEVVRMGTKEKIPIRTFIQYWSIPDMMIPFIPRGGNYQTFMDGKKAGASEERTAIVEYIRDGNSGCDMQADEDLIRDIEAGEHTE